MTLPQGVIISKRVCLILQIIRWENKMYIFLSLLVTGIVIIYTYTYTGTAGYVQKQGTLGYITIQIDKGSINCSKNATVTFDPYTLPGFTIERYEKNNDESCIPLKFSTERLPITALASHPGSGNTWTWFLIQQVTGRETNVHEIL